MCDMWIRHIFTIQTNFFLKFFHLLTKRRKEGWENGSLLNTVFRMDVVSLTFFLNCVIFGMNENVPRYLWVRNKLPAVEKDICSLFDCIHCTWATSCCAIIDLACVYCWGRKYVVFLSYFRKCIVNWLYLMTSVWCEWELTILKFISNRLTETLLRLEMISICF